MSILAGCLCMSWRASCRSETWPLDFSSSPPHIHLKIEAKHEVKSQVSGNVAKVDMNLTWILISPTNWTASRQIWGQKTSQRKQCEYNFTIQGSHLQLEQHQHGVKRQVNGNVVKLNVNLIWTRISPTNGTAATEHQHKKSQHCQNQNLHRIWHQSFLFFFINFIFLIY